MTYTASDEVEIWFEDTQEEIGEWAEHNFPGDGRVMAVGSVVEESGELMRAVRKQAQGIRGTYEEWDAEIRKELSDTLIALFQAAANCKVDLLPAFQERWAEVRNRDFQKDRIGHGLPQDD